MSYTGSHKFYDKVARKFGDYGSSGASYTTKYQTENPEEVFKKLLLKYSEKDRSLLESYISTHQTPDCSSKVV